MSKLSITTIPWTLASVSPRRLTLLRQVGIEPKIRPAWIEEVAEAETVNSGRTKPEETVLINAERKADAVEPGVGGGFLLAADTMVVIEERSIGKPKNHDDAVKLLNTLAGTWHEVLTAFDLRWIDNGLRHAASELTRVHFRPLTAAEIEAYVAGGQPFDKAGGYGAQDKAGAFIDRIEGCFFNVMGLPLARVVAKAQEWVDEVNLKGDDSV